MNFQFSMPFVVKHRNNQREKKINSEEKEFMEKVKHMKIEKKKKPVNFSNMFENIKHAKQGCGSCSGVR
jgi:hypothetical protein